MSTVPSSTVAGEVWQLPSLNLPVRKF